MSRRRGRGWAACYLKIGMLRSQDVSGAIVQVRQDGSVNVLVGSVAIGAGTITALTQIAAEELGVDPETVTVVHGDTHVVPYDSGVVGSRSTYIVGNAVRAAARDAKAMLLETAAERLGAPPDALEARAGFIEMRDTPARRLPFAEVAFLTQYDRRTVVIGTGSFQPTTGRVALTGGAESFRRDANAMDPETGQGTPIAAFSYAAALAEVDVDTETGQVDVVRFVVATDCGRAINPLVVEGQQEGATVMGMSHALFEDTRPLRGHGEGPTLDLTDYVIATAMDVPNIVTLLVECPEPTGPFGAKGIGEINVILPAPAIANAIYDAVGVRITSLPATPDKVLAGILAQRGEGETDASSS